MSQPNPSALLRANPAFDQLVRRRRRLVIGLTLATLLPYYAFVLVAGFAPQLLGHKVFADSAITIGWPVGLALIVGTWLLTGVYIRRANGEFDELTARIVAGDKR